MKATLVMLGKLEQVRSPRQALSETLRCAPRRPQEQVRRALKGPTPGLSSAGEEASPSFLGGRGPGPVRLRSPTSWMERPRPVLTSRAFPPLRRLRPLPHAFAGRYIIWRSMCRFPVRQPPVPWGTWPTPAALLLIPRRHPLAAGPVSRHLSPTQRHENTQSAMPLRDRQDP